MTTTAAAIELIVDSLTLEEKVGLLTGRDFWHTVAIERIGLRAMRCSDGPGGVRGERWDERHPSLNLPSSTAPLRGAATSPPVMATRSAPRPAARASTSSWDRRSTCTARRTGAATSSA